MISKFGKELIASGIPEDVVKRAYDFVEKANIGKGLVGKDAELCRSFKDFATTAYITGAREQEEGILKKVKGGIVSMSIILFALAATTLMFAVVGAISMMLGLDKED